MNNLNNNERELIRRALRELVDVLENERVEAVDNMDGSEIDIDREIEQATALFLRLRN